MSHNSRKNKRKSNKKGKAQSTKNKNKNTKQPTSTHRSTATSSAACSASSPLNNSNDRDEDEEEEEKLMEMDTEESTNNDHPHTEPDCCDKFLFTSIGFFFVIVSMLVTLVNEHDFILAQIDLNSLTARIQSVALHTNGSIANTEALPNILENDFPIYLTSKLGTDNEWPMDGYTEITYDSLALRIRTEMYQWKEETETVSHRKEGSAVDEITKKFKYSKIWSSSIFDSAEFKYEDEHYNPPPSVSNIKPRLIWAKNILIGNQLYVAKSLKYKLYQSKMWRNITTNISIKTLDGFEFRDGYLFKAYDSYESFYEEGVYDDDEDDYDTPQQTTNGEKAPPSESESDSDSATTADTTDTENGDIMRETTDTKAEEEEEEEEEDEEDEETRRRLDTPRLIIGDVRMTIESMDTRGKEMTFIGSIVTKSNGKGYNMFQWTSDGQLDYLFFKYGTFSVEECLLTFAQDNTYKKWVSRSVGFLFISFGFMLLSNILNYIIIVLLPSDKIPSLESYLQIIIGSFVGGSILWILTVINAWFIIKLEIALTLTSFIFIALFVINYLSKAEDTKMKSKNE